MNWNEIVITIIGAAATVLTTFLTVWIKSLYENNKNKIKNEKAQAVLGQVTDMLTAAVAATSSTYVKELKKNGSFDADAQKAAFDKTFDVVKKQLTAESTAILTELYGDVDTYLTNKIEQTVEELKK